MSLIQVLEHLVEETRNQVDPDLKPDDFFELFVSDLVTRDFGLDWQDIESGIADGGDDGQIDAIYILVDGINIREEKEFDLKNASRKDRNNLKYYIAFVASRLMAGKENPTRDDLGKLLVIPPSPKVLDAAFMESQKRYRALGSNDDAARGGVLPNK